MKTSSSAKFPLIPSAQARYASFAPIAFVPAVPIRIGGSNGPQIYALIDTQAAVGSIAGGAVRRLKLGLLEKEGPLGEQVVRVRVTLCDSGFQPWLEFRDVPLRVAEQEPEERREHEVTLGFESCLAHLRLVVDYRKKSLTIAAPKRLQVGATPEAERDLPSQFIEGDQLLRMGSYRSAIAMFGAAFEEALRGHLLTTARPVSESGERFPDLQVVERVFTTEKANSRLLRHASMIVDWRNRAVHGSDVARFSKEEALLARRYVRDVLRWLGERPHVVRGPLS